MTERIPVTVDGTTGTIITGAITIIITSLMKRTALSRDPLGTALRNAVKMSDKILNTELNAIYDVYRSEALNKEYYGNRLAFYRLLNNTIEILIAVGMAGSGLSALTIWNNPVGKIIWGVLTLLSSFLAIIKPILQLNKKVEHYSSLFRGHTDNYINLQALVEKIKRTGELSDELRRLFITYEATYRELSRLDDPKPNQRVADRCEALVRSRIPRSALWFPPSPETGSSSGQKPDGEPSR